MKTEIFSIAIRRWLLSLALSAGVCGAADLFSQKTNVWKGGAPGRETDWFCAKNWSLGAIPGEFDLVLIPDVSTTSRRYPVIKSGEVEASGIVIASGATLTLFENAQLAIFGSNGSDEGLLCAGTLRKCAADGKLLAALTDK